MKEKIKLAFQGEKGAYSHLACAEVFPNIEAKGMSYVALCRDEVWYFCKNKIAGSP